MINWKGRPGAVLCLIATKASHGHWENGVVTLSLECVHLLVPVHLFRSDVLMYALSLNNIIFVQLVDYQLNKVWERTNKDGTQEYDYHSSFPFLVRIMQIPPQNLIRLLTRQHFQILIFESHDIQTRLVLVATAKAWPEEAKNGWLICHCVIDDMLALIILERYPGQMDLLDLRLVLHLKTHCLIFLLFQYLFESEFQLFLNIDALRFFSQQTCLFCKAQIQRKSKWLILPDELFLVLYLEE